MPQPAWVDRSSKTRFQLVQFKKKVVCLVDFFAGPGSIEILNGWLDQTDKLTWHLMSNPVEWSLGRGGLFAAVQPGLGTHADN
jgi:hypothetical protein